MKVRVIGNRNAIISDIQNSLSSCEDAKFYHRLDLVLLTISGMPVKEVATLYNESPKTISTWTKKVIEHGVDSLNSKKQPGRPPRLSQEQLTLIDNDLQKSPEVFGYDFINWDGVVLSQHIQAHYNVSLQVRQCQRILHKLGYTLQRPQTNPSGGNPEEQEAFKKNDSDGIGI